MKKNSFTKMHGLGNEYIVLDSENIDFSLIPETIRRLCNIHYGIGSDGIVLKVPSKKADFGFRVFNPDGSEAEKSGNGLRIFSKYIFDCGFTSKKVFSVETLTDIVHSEIINVRNNKADQVKVEMGKAIFSSSLIPVRSELPEFFGQKITAGDKEFEVNCVSVGNPHCVIITDRPDEKEVREYGPLIENHPLFPNRINVQFAKPVSRKEASILIWERGAGFTQASGSSSCAVACVLVKRGLAERDLVLDMPGGQLKIQISEHWDISMTGEVREIASGTISNEFFE